MSTSALRQTAPDWCFFDKAKLPADAYYQALKAAGYAGVEMADEKHWPLLKAAGLELVTICAPGMDHGFSDPSTHATLVPKVIAAIELAKANRSPSVIVFSGNADGRSHAEGVANCIAGLKQVAAAAERAGVTLLLEVLCRHDHGDYQANNNRFAVEVIRGVGSPRVKILYDLYHMFKMGEDVQREVIAHLDLIGHLHVAGAPRRNFPGLAPGQEMDYSGIVRAIHAAGYRGWWGQEFLPDGDALDELRRARQLFDSFVSAQQAAGG